MTIRRTAQNVAALSIALWLSICATPEPSGAQELPTVHVTGDTLTVRVVLARDTVTVPSPPDTVVVRDTVYLPSPPDTVAVPCDCEPEPPDEPDPDPSQPIGRVVGLILDPPANWSQRLGDTVTLRVVGGITEYPDGSREPSTEQELRDAGVTTVHSGGYARPVVESDGLTIVVLAERVGSTRIDVRVGHPARLVGQRRVTVLPRDPSDPLPEPEPDPEPEPEPEPEPTEPGEPVEGEGASQVPGLEVDEPLCLRLISGISAVVSGDTVRIAQRADLAGEQTWCITADWPVLTHGDAARARVYPAEPPYGGAP